jgi:hypothetical protein
MKRNNHALNNSETFQSIEPLVTPIGRLCQFFNLLLKVDRRLTQNSYVTQTVPHCVEDQETPYGSE